MRPWRLFGHQELPLRTQDHPLPASLRSLQIGSETTTSFPRLADLAHLPLPTRFDLPLSNVDVLRAAEQDPRRLAHNALAEHRDGEMKTRVGLWNIMYSPLWL